MNTPAATVYYNSACPVCQSGIARQQDELERCGVAMNWVDIHQRPEEAAKLGTSVEAIRERLHVVGEGGELLIGADALAELWLQTPRYRWLGRLVRLPALRWVAGRLYRLFARALYRWNLQQNHW